MMMRSIAISVMSGACLGREISRSLTSCLQLLARMPAFAFYLIGTIVVWYIRPYSCTHYVETWQGLLAISISVSSTTIALSYLAWPVNDKEDTWMMNVRAGLLCVTLESVQLVPKDRALSTVKRFCMYIEDKKRDDVG